MTNSLAVFLGVSHGESKIAAFQLAFVAHLAARFRVERRFVQNDNRFLASADAVYGFTVNKQCGHFTGQFQMVVTLEFRRAIHADHRVVICAKTAGLTRTTALFFHCSFKARFVDFDIALAANVCGQVNRETVSVIQAESGVAVQRIAGQFGQLFIEQSQTALKSTRKLLFFGFQNLLDQRLLAFQFIARCTHDANQWPHQLIEEGIFRAQHVAVTDSTTNDTAQHVATVFIRRGHAVSNQERTRANMVRDNAQRFVAQIGCTGHFSHGFNQGAEQIDVVVGVDVLQNSRDTLQTHTGIYGRLRQRLHSAVNLTVELHEDDVPDLNVAIAIFFCRARRSTPNVVAVIVEDLGTRTARTCVAHLPEVVRRIRRAFVVADADNALTWDTDFFFPDFVSFIIGFVHGNPQTLFRQVEPVFTGQQFPRELDSIVFEVVAEAEVAQHLEESMVTCGVADVFQIVVFTARTHATL
ncbi:hypothetical protein D3C80_108910 [compost metagenome]